MNTKMKMRMLSLLLCFVMLVGLVPTSAFAWTTPTLSGNGGGTWNIQLSAEGVLSWNEQQSATSYTIEVDETAMGVTVTKIENINGTSYNLINRFKELKIENGTYYFQIKANGPDTTSNTINFKYVSPQEKLSAPQNLRWDGTVAKWDSVANATGYEVKLYSDSGSLQLSKTTTETQYDWSTNVYNDGFWFEVVATGDNYRNSNAAEGPKYGTYSWTAPTLTGGKAEWNVTLSDDGMLRWNDMGSATYDIYVDETAMGGTVTNIYSINTNAYNLINRFKTLKLENGTYYFTIRANDTDTTSGDIRITYVSPESKLSAPQNLRWDGTVAKWDSVVNATGYTVKLYSDSGSLQLSKTTTETQYDWSTNVYNDGFWFEVIATAADYRDSNAAESPKYGSPLVPNTYTVTYDANGGSGSMGTEYIAFENDGFAKNYTFPQCGFTAPDGKEFDKWQWYYNSNPSQTTDITPGNSPWLSGSITVKALWKDKSNTYTVTYDANGGSGSMGTEYIAVENDGFAKTYTFPECGFTAPSGKEFDKWLWYYDSNPGSTNEIAPGNSPWLSGSITVKALWKDKSNTSTYTVTYDANGGSGSMGTEYIAVENDGFAKTYTFPQCGFTAPNGKEFDKWLWYYDSNPGSTNEIAPGNSPWLSGSITVKALWKDKSNTYTVTYDANGGTGSMAQEFLTHDNNGFAKNYTFPQCGFTAPDGKEFDKWQWYYNSDPSQTTDTTPGNSPWLSGSITVKALWKDKSNTYTVTYDANGGSAVAAQNIEAGQKATNPADPTKDGYDFKGWTLNGSAYDFNTAVNGNITLVATWEQQQVVPTTYTVSFAANGGTGTMADVTGISGEYTLPENGFTAPDGKQFKAWSVGGSEKAVGDKITVTADTTVTAVWETIPAGHTHSYGSEWKSDADKHWHECSCGAKAEEATHTASDWITDTPATATTDGTKHKKCTECGYIMARETIPATGGSVVIIPDTDETDKSEPENPGTGAAVNPGTGAAAAGSSFGYPFVALAAVHAIYTGTKKDEE